MTKKLTISLMTGCLIILAALINTPPVWPQNNNDAMRRQQEEMRRQEDMRRQQQMDEMRRQQQQEQIRRQQDDMRRQQEAQRQRQQQEDMRRQQQQRDEMRRQEEARQRQQQQDQQRQQTQRQQQQQQQQTQQRQQQDQNRQQQQTQQRQQQQQRAVGTMQSGSNKPTGMTFSNGVARLTRPLTAAEISRGFTGKLTADGRALIKFQNRVFAVPASRISGLSAKLAAQQRAARWSPQQGTAINASIRKIAQTSVKSSGNREAQPGGNGGNQPTAGGGGGNNSGNKPPPTSGGDGGGKKDCSNPPCTPVNHVSGNNSPPTGGGGDGGGKRDCKTLSCIFSDASTRPGAVERVRLKEYLGGYGFKGSYFESSAKEQNSWHETNTGFKSPFSEKHPVYMVEGRPTSSLVRVYTEGTNRKDGYWLVPEAEIVGKTPQEMQNVLALKEEPTHIARWIPSKDSYRFAVGVIRHQDFDETKRFSGGATQFELKETPLEQDFLEGVSVTEWKRK